MTALCTAPQLTRGDVDDMRLLVAWVLKQHPGQQSGPRLLAKLEAIQDTPREARP